MRQQWRDLLFLHWRYSAAEIQATLPPGLTVDTHDGHAYLGVVPFAMARVRPRGLPAVPGLSDFLELNLRTYVYDRAGVPGVWFYSLDANQALAVRIARRLFHLPYVHARMQTQRSPDGWRQCVSERLAGAWRGARTGFAYREGTARPASAPGSLEYFLVERYRLFASDGERLWRGAVSHTPYELSDAEVTMCDASLLMWNGFTPTERPPDHVVCSRGVDVTVFPLQRVAVG